MAVTSSNLHLCNCKQDYDTDDVIIDGEDSSYCKYVKYKILNEGVIMSNFSIRIKESHVEDSYRPLDLYTYVIEIRAMSKSNSMVFNYKLNCKLNSNNSYNCFLSYLRTLKLTDLDEFVDTPPNVLSLNSTGDIYTVNFEDDVLELSINGIRCFRYKSQRLIEFDKLFMICSTLNSFTSLQLIEI